MKLKFYLRGLGIGILVTWLIMGVINRNEVEAARAETRAAVLALYEQETQDTPLTNEYEGEEQNAGEPILIRDETQDTDGLYVTLPEPETVPETGSDVTSDADADSNLDLASGASPDTMAEVDENASGSADENADGDGDEQEEPVVIINSEDNEEQGIAIVVLNGDDSGTVSRKLYNAGIIDNASEYDAYLMQHGYDKRINSGTKIIYEGDSWQTIAEKLTSSSSN